MQGSWAAYYHCMPLRMPECRPHCLCGRGYVVRRGYQPVEVPADAAISSRLDFISKAPLSQSCDRRVAEQLESRKHNPTLTPV